jgi:AcrR family transcriptional regulator
LVDQTTVPPSSPLVGLKPRVLEIVATARTVLEEGGPEALSMHRIAELLGIRTPSLYKHVASKREIEHLLIVGGLWEQGEVSWDALRTSDDPIAAITWGFRRWALEHPHLYSLIMARPLERDEATIRAWEHSAMPLREIFGERVKDARRLWIAALGLVSLELTGGVPYDWDVEEMWSDIIESARD